MKLSWTRQLYTHTPLLQEGFHSNRFSRLLRESGKQWS